MTIGEERLRVGLCTDCQHAKTIVSAKGSRFTLCNKSQIDPRFPKYPRLPVRACSGYAAKAAPDPQP
jgi:hypothetical protein